MTGTSSVIAWMKNRTGILTASIDLPHFVQDSLEQNRSGRSFTDTFGQRDFWGFVGFVDLKGFSSFSQDKTPEQISVFVKPFLLGIIDVITESHGLIDKTIGDEIMFVLPQIEGGPIAYFEMYAIVRKFREFAKKNSDYRFRIGMSCGDMFLDSLETKHYTEWFVSGGPIIAAKRAMSLEEIASPDPCVLALTLRKDESDSLTKWAESIEKFPPCGWRRLDGQKVTNAKGIGELSYQIMEKYEPNLDF